MKHFLSVAVVAAALAFAAVSPAAAIDVQAGGRGGAEVTVGAPTVDRNDVVIDRCECDGGPLLQITVHTSGADRVVPIDRITAQLIRTTDPVPAVIGAVYQVTNMLGAGENAIVLLVSVRDNVLGAVQTIAVRRSAFIWTDSGPVLNTTMADLRASIERAMAGAGA